MSNERARVSDERRGLASAPMRRALLAVAVVAGVAAAACSGSADDSTATPATTAADRRTTTSEATTTTAAPDLAAASVTLSPVAPADAPTAIAHRPGDDALYVAEQGGPVLALVPGPDGSRTVAATPVLDLADLVRSGGEQGLLGLTFSPDGERLYVHYTGRDGETVVDEHTFVPGADGGGTADPATRRTLLTVAQPQANHNGGQLAFGPDGALYLGLGDGGGANDEGPGHAPEGNGQSPDTLLGKIVRIDTATGAATAQMSGLRNPWRFSFDRDTDDLWIGDVGQNAWEEITRLPFAQAAGANLGWPLLEGSHPFRTDAAPGTVGPTFEISQDTGACAVVGGHVYRGTRIPDLRGAYLFTDNCDGRVRALRLGPDGAVELERDLGISVQGPTTFGEDGAGELYVASGTDGVFRIDPTAVTSGFAPTVQSSPRVKLEEIAAVDTPTAMAVRADDDALYVAEQDGRVVSVRDGDVETFLDLTDLVRSGGEQGLLGLAFSPDGTELYVHHTDRDGNTRVAAYGVEGDERPTVDPESRRVVLRIRDRESNHNGGQLAFGPDGELYLGMGDGGGAGDKGVGHAPEGNGQSPDTLLGKILRVDTNDGGAEICDLGLRNPWRFSFDRDTGDLWIADVGQSAWEEIDRVPGDEPCGHNFGWPVYEGEDQYRAGQIDDHVEPVAVLSHDEGNCSVIGGYVYRGREIPELEGWYVFTDYCNGELRALRLDHDGELAERVRLGPDVESPSSFGEDEAGELYVLSQSDGLFRIASRG